MKLYALKRRKNPRVLGIKIPWLGQTGSDDTAWFGFRFSLALQTPCFYFCEEVIESPWGIWVKEGVQDWICGKSYTFLALSKNSSVLVE